MVGDKRYFESKRKAIETGQFSEQNKKVVLDYLRFKESKNWTYARLAKIVGVMYSLLERCKGDLTKISQEDIQELVIWINGQNRKDWTKVTQLKVIKTFLYWLDERYSIGLKLKKMKIQKPKNSLMPEYLLSPEALNRLLNATDDLQMRLFIGLTYESAARISEILNLKLQNVQFTQHGARIMVKGKNGQRPLTIIWYAGLLRQFMDTHPLKDTQDALLWYVNGKDGIQPIIYEVMRKRLKRLCKKARIHKKVYWHLLRHTRLTELAKDLPEQTLKVVASWSPDSKMASTYVHLSQKNVEDSLLSKVYGIKINGSDENQGLRICPKCNDTNPNYVKICQRCRTPLDEKELMQEAITTEKLKEVEDWSKKFMAFLKAVEKKHPDIWEDMKSAFKD